MKKLKYSCPFCGKQYPFFAVVIAIFVSATLSLTMVSFPVPLPFFGSIWFFIGLPLAVLVGCFLFEQHLTPDEKALIDAAPYPLWEPVPPELIEAVKQRKQGTSSAMITILFIGGGIGFGCILPRRGEPNFALAGCIAVVLALLFVIDYFMRAGWKTIDNTAVFTTVPVHHMFDVVHKNRRSEWTESYIVVYLPDGRYVLHAQKGDGDARGVTFVKYRGSVMWLPYFGQM